MRWRGLAVGIALAAASLLTIPAADAAAVQFVNCLEPAPCAVLSGCLLVGVTGWPPQPVVNPDCVGDSGSPPPTDEEATDGEASSNSNATAPAEDV